MLLYIVVQVDILSLVLQLRIANPHVKLASAAHLALCEETRNDTVANREVTVRLRLTTIEIAWDVQAAVKYLKNWRLTP